MNGVEDTTHTAVAKPEDLSIKVPFSLVAQTAAKISTDAVRLAHIWQLFGVSQTIVQKYWHLPMRLLG